MIEPTAANVSSLEVFGRIYDEGTWSRHELSKVQAHHSVESVLCRVFTFALGNEVTATECDAWSAVISLESDIASFSSRSPSSREEREKRVGCFQEIIALTLFRRCKFNESIVGNELYSRFCKLFF